MRVMVIVKASPQSEQGTKPPVEALKAMSAFNEELLAAGVMLAAEGLRPSSQGALVKCTKGNYVVTDGPFAETKELIAGFWIWKVESMAEAIEWLKKSPFDGGVELELRTVGEVDDFGDAATPEFREKHANMRRQLAKNQMTLAEKK